MENNQTSADATSDKAIELFESSAKENGQSWWEAPALMQALGYKDLKTFSQVINEAIGSCMRLGVSVSDTFQQVGVVSDGATVQSFKMNRFGCYLVAMHADVKKEEVLRVRGYLAAFAAAIAERQFADNSLLRVELRDKLKDGEALMSGVAFAAGVKGTDMAIFKDAGYQGMYNMGRKALLRERGLKIADVIYDYMDVVELAAHNYRVTQTAARIKTRGLRGLAQTSHAAKEVGAKVRHEIIENTGKPPESLPVVENIKQLESGLRKTSKGMKKINAPKKAPGSAQVQHGI
jgi:DNA-damage-inducible protein D